MVKTSTPQGCPLFFHWLIPLLHRPRGPSLPSLRTPPWPSPPEPSWSGLAGLPLIAKQWLPPSCLMILNLVVEARIEDTSSTSSALFWISCHSWFVSLLRASFAGNLKTTHELWHFWWVEILNKYTCFMMKTSCLSNFLTKMKYTCNAIAREKCILLVGCLNISQYFLK